MGISADNPELQLQAAYVRRAAKILRQKVVEEAMHSSLILAEETQQRFFDAQREYSTIKEGIEADNIEIRKLEGKDDDDINDQRDMVSNLITLFTVSKC